MFNHLSSTVALHIHFFYVCVFSGRFLFILCVCVFYFFSSLIHFFTGISSENGICTAGRYCTIFFRQTLNYFRTAKKNIQHTHTKYVRNPNEQHPTILKHNERLFFLTLALLTLTLPTLGSSHHRFSRPFLVGLFSCSILFCDTRPFGFDHLAGPFVCSIKLKTIYFRSCTTDAACSLTFSSISLNVFSVCSHCVLDNCEC